MIIGIDATNIRHGGGLTHLYEILKQYDHQIKPSIKVVVWSGEITLKKIGEYGWLKKVEPDLLNRNLFYRMFWQRFLLSREATKEGCDVLFMPGGSFTGTFHPVVSMSQNLLPFEYSELRRYRGQLTYFRLLFLQLTQTRTFKRSEGVIFLTKYAEEAVLKVTGPLQGVTIQVSHGYNEEISSTPKQQRSIDEYSDENPYRILYVSTIDEYKHQWHVVDAIVRLRSCGIPVVLDLVGSSPNGNAYNKLREAIREFDPEEVAVNYRGEVPYQEIKSVYSSADMAMWASSCETFGIILLEAMSAGLPVASSNRGATHEILGDAGCYFNPENPDEIYRCLDRMIHDPELREEYSRKSFSISKKYSWNRCAKETFEFLIRVATSPKKV